jgi:hypothetical protein
MRIWDIEPEYLSNNHLLGEHRELHAIWTYLTTEKGSSYRKHPETLRWKGKLPALYKRHEQLILEFNNRGFKHHSPLVHIDGTDSQDILINTIEEQKQLLMKKNPEWYGQWSW